MLAFLLAAGIAAAPAAALPHLTTPDGDTILATGADGANRPTVPVMIDGRGPFAFVVDTGAERTVVSNELAGTLGLQAAGTVHLQGVAGLRDVQTVQIPRLSVVPDETFSIRAPPWRRAIWARPGCWGWIRSSRGACCSISPSAASSSAGGATG